MHFPYSKLKMLKNVLISENNLTVFIKQLNFDGLLEVRRLGAFQFADNVHAFCLWKSKYQKVG